MKFVLLVLLGLASLAKAGAASYFAPNHRLSGIGVSRDDISQDLLAVRTDFMIQSQTFAILRDPLALPGAKRITSPKLQATFRSAAAASGVPVNVLEAIAYLESWGDTKAESPAGPRGIMQISEATARRIGLRIVYAKRYRVTTEKVGVKRRGRTTYKVVRHRTPYTVLVRDDRLIPARAIPAAARYLAGMEQRYGGQDWAVFAYHCGEGCVNEMIELTRQARGIPKDKLTVARMFFSSNPAWNRELYAAIQRNMERDYSPTYWFRIQRAQQLLALYRRDPGAFTALSSEYKSQLSTGPRAPHRLAVWLKKEDLLFQSCNDLRLDGGRRLAKVFENPEYFGYVLRPTIGADDPENRPYYLQASPAAIGTLAYVAYETRRLHEALKPRGEVFQPLEVTSLVQPADHVHTRAEALAHCSGQVFDISYAQLPPGERECLRFVLNDLGWEGYLGFVEEGVENLHIGCSPTSREFFTTVFQEALESREWRASVD
jgi:soluble lytic murein transglycosylase-like protein